MSRLIIKNCAALKRDAVISAMQDPATIQAPNKLGASTPTVGGVAGPKSGTPNSEYYANHSGVDFTGSRGDPIYAIEGGKCWIDPTGLYLLIYNGDSWGDSYWHMDKILVESGEVVKAGQQIGVMGDYGADFDPPKAYGVHLHFYHSEGGKCADAYARAAQIGSGTVTGGGSFASTGYTPTGGSDIPDKEQYYRKALGWPTLTTGEYAPLCDMACYDEPDGKQIGKRYFDRSERFVANQVITAGVTGIWLRTNWGYVRAVQSSAEGTHNRLNCWRVGDIPADWAPQNIGF